MNTEEYNDRMRGYLPWYEKQSPQFNGILYAYASEINDIEKNINKLKNNLLIGTSDFTLDILEKDFAIITPIELPDTLRREQIIAKSRSSFAQTTEQSIIDVSEAFANGSISLQATETPGLYSVTFTSQLGAPYNLEALKIAIRDILPAHLQVEYIFIYNTWSGLSQYKWEYFTGLTWEGLKIFEEGGL